MGRVLRGRKDTVNALMIGSSAIFRYWNPPQAYEEQDFTSAMLASSIQDLNMAPYIMEEAVKSQNVDVFVIEVRTMIARNTNDDHSQEERDYWFELLISGMNPSITRLQAITWWKLCEESRNDVSDIKIS